MSKKAPANLSDDITASGLRFAIVVSRWNGEVTSRLTEGALASLRSSGADEGDVAVFECPGAFELPLVVQRLARSGQYDAVLALGAVVRGGTPHFEYVASGAASGIASVALQTGIPCIFGVLTTDTMRQAMERAGEGPENKGWQAAQAAIEMVILLRGISAGKPDKRSG